MSAQGSGERPFEVVRYSKDDALDGQIKMLKCLLCDHSESAIEHRDGADRSGLPRYRRMRQAIVRHIKTNHPS